MAECERLEKEFGLVREPDQLVEAFFFEKAARNHQRIWRSRSSSVWRQGSRTWH
ncbi:hypothetical protein JDN40_01120 [Rhodomicrobium vannielii ATCC 17100]|uniref:hypothetical protein n=1 Tax=Rhodomicrobium vannielii TaxID=1069 RepID=UPI0019181EFD|nr:hypothetical protein [Rhodomicrobium vannielii]MBJ7532724.1 hypothetical protein [Rhodomicrobium vannielii ATCC 17100]